LNARLVHLYRHVFIYLDKCLIYMKQYKILSNSHIEILEREVNEMLTQGWQLQGGVGVAYKHEHAHNLVSHLVFVQALSKE
jgi:hypothetical protein